MKKVATNVVTNDYIFIPWLIAWMFTIGFCKLTAWQGVWAFFIWPYHIGNFFQ